MDFLPAALRSHGRERVRHAEDGLSGSTLQYPPAQQPMPIPQQGQAGVRQTEDGLSGSTLQFPPTHQPMPIPQGGPVGYDPENKLELFRHLVGIHSTKEFVKQRTEEKGHFRQSHSHNMFNFEGRAAPNKGIYNRVCHREAAAKRGYKIASVLINSCLGIQVIVAAALTAMGAANSSHVGITAFGAINTVIAGFLTYLKGSGLPNRIRWYENEWKKVREYIEQRERDFSRPGCQLDVNKVVEAVETMYEEVKADIQNNTPENYISVSDIRSRGAAATNPQIPSLKDMMSSSTAAASQGKSKFEEYEQKYGHKAVEFLQSLAHKEEERLRRIEGDIGNGQAKALAALEDEKDKITHTARDWERDFEGKSARVAEKEYEHARSGLLNRGLSFARDLENTKSGLLHRGESFARGQFDAAKAAALQRGDALAREVDATRTAALQRSDALARDVDASRAAALSRTEDLSHNLAAAKTAALQRGRDYEADVHAKATAAQQELSATRDAAQRAGEGIRQDLEVRAAQVSEAERALEREAARTGDAVQRVGEGVVEMGREVQRAGESVQRVGRAVEEEVQTNPHRKE